MSADPHALLTVPDAKAAAAVADFLSENGFPAETVVPPPAAVSDALTGAASYDPGNGVVVRVLDAAHADAARELLKSAADRVGLLKAAREARTGDVTATCEECSRASTWPAAVMGTTGTCPHCAAYLDIPDPDDDWAGVDVGTDDELQ